ncbi:hypothetical protein B6U99_04805 [Candidatus Geothermarchaeota archaeon ex4572_27]|nr:MAG: hypothetical protein B6U99_04805 [Candidatus Geothermarchaeota archaeon ex4572_27]
MIEAPLIIAAATAAATAATSRAGLRPAKAIAAIGSMACMAASFLVAPIVEDVPAILSRGPAILFLDAYGALLLEKFTMAAAASMLLAVTYLDRLNDPAYYASMAASLLGIVGLIYSGDLVSFYAFYALMNMSSYYFMAPRPSDEVGVDTGPRDSLTLYLAFDAASMTLVALGFAVLAMSAGSTSIPVIAARAPRWALWASLALTMAGFWVKLAIVPAHAWFPGVNPWAPSPSSAFMAAAVRVTGFYGATRMLFTAYRCLLPQVKDFLLYAALVNIAVGCLLALGQDDLKRLVTCSSVGEGGVLMMAWGVASTTALQGVFFHVLNLVLIKCLFFSSIAYFIYASDRRTIYALRGASKGMLLGATGFMVASLSTCAVPPLNGFHSKFLVFLSLVEDGLIWAACAFVVLDLLMLAVLMRAVHAMYDRGAEVQVARRPGLGLKLLIASLIASCLAIGVAPSMFMEGAYKAAIACLEEAWMVGV